jgi:S-adenosylmethionine:tRNA ribosyltransferase-isomerase
MKTAPWFSSGTRGYFFKFMMIVGVKGGSVDWYLYGYAVNKAHFGSFITVHCGLGAFDAIEVEDLTKHKMSSEQVIIGNDACDAVNQGKADGHHICAIGVSTLRATESAVGTDGLLKEFDGWTNRFIFPPYDFGLADSLVANFYQPESTMLMATAAFGGYDLIMEA